jgi:hypothetical protein
MDSAVRFIDFDTGAVTGTDVPATFDLAWAWEVGDDWSGWTCDATLLDCEPAPGVHLPRAWLVQMLGEAGVRGIERETGAALAATETPAGMAAE